MVKNTSCVPIRMIAGSLFIAVTRGLESTFTLPCVANALSSALKSPTFNASVKPPEVAGASVCDSVTELVRLPSTAFQLMPAENSSRSSTSMTFASICT